VLAYILLLPSTSQNSHIIFKVVADGVKENVVCSVGVYGAFCFCDVIRLLNFEFPKAGLLRAEMFFRSLAADNFCCYVTVDCSPQVVEMLLKQQLLA
jgi:hypothetical protein